MRQLVRPLMVTVMLGFATLVVVAGPAAADPAAPTNYSSTVRSIEPATQAVSARVVGGDSFLEVRANRGHEVVVFGYDDEPYLRIGTDGRVEENVRSPAVVLNQARYGRVESNSDADAKAEPEWKQIASGGTYAWHDHRIHWMSSAAPPPQLDGASSGAVFDWTVPINVDGQAASIKGDLFLQEPPSKAPYVAIGVVLFAVFAGLMRWRRWASGPVLAGCALMAVVVSLVDQLSIPAAAGRQFSLYFTPSIAFVCAAVATVATRSKYAAILRIAAAVVLPLWIFRYASVLNNAVLPGDVSPTVMRISVVAAVGAVLAFLTTALLLDLRVGALESAGAPSST